MVTWDDYTFREEKSNNTGAWLESNWARPNGLVIVAASNYDPRGVLPQITIEGVEHTVIADYTSTPYVTYWDWIYSRWLYYYWPWYYRRYWYWYWYRYAPVNSRVVLVVPHQEGTIRARAEGSNIFDHRLRVFTANITPASGKGVRKVAFTDSVKEHVIDRDFCYVECQANDILIAMGNDASPNWALAEIEKVSGPATQELMSIRPAMYNRSVRIRIWRVKQPGTMVLGYYNCNAGRMAVRLMPNVEVYTLTPPTISEPRAYFEIQVEQDEVGNVKRPDWFANLYNTLRHSQNMGLQRAWLREVLERKYDEVGRITGVRVRRIEHWAIPAANAGQIGSDALIFADRAEWLARVVMHDNQW